MPIVVEVGRAGRNTRVGRASRRRRSAAAAGRPPIPPSSGRSTSSRRRARRSTRRTASPATRRPARACRGAFPALDGSKIATGPKAAHIDIVLNGKPARRWPPFEAAVGRRHRRGDHLRAQHRGATRPATWSSPPTSRPHASNADASEGEPIDEQAATHAFTITATATITTTTTHHARRRDSCAGSRRPTTRTSARCTCGSRFTMFIVGGIMALMHPRRAVPARPADRRSGVLQPAHHACTA